MQWAPGDTCTSLEGTGDADQWDSCTWQKMTDKKKAVSLFLLLTLRITV